jgi:hypothetical protein
LDGRYRQGHFFASKPAFRQRSAICVFNKVTYYIFVFCTYGCKGERSEDGHRCLAAVAITTTGYLGEECLSLVIKEYPVHLANLNSQTVYNCSSDHYKAPACIYKLEAGNQIATRFKPRRPCAEACLQTRTTRSFIWRLTQKWDDRQGSGRGWR